MRPFCCLPLFLVVVICSGADTQTIAASTSCQQYYESTNCNNVTVIPCNQTSMICYVHANVCNLIDRILKFATFDDNWQIVFSAYNFKCTDANILNCVTESVFTASPMLQASPEFCVTANRGINKNNILFRTLGTQPATLAIPAPSFPYSPPCSILTQFGSNISFDHIIFDGSGCSTRDVFPTTSVITYMPGVLMNRVTFVNIFPGVMSVGLRTNIVFNTSITAVPGTPMFYLRLWVAVTAAPSTGVITALEPLLNFMVITSNASVAVNTSAFVAWNFINALVYPCAVCVAPGNITITVKEINWSFTIGVLIIVFGTLFLVIIVRICWEKRHHLNAAPVNHPETMAKEQQKKK